MSKLTDEIRENTENTHIETVTEEVAEVTENDKIEEPVKAEEHLPNNVISLDMSDATRTKIWVNGDCQKVIELNLTDMGIVGRFSETYPKLLELQNEIDNGIAKGTPEDMDDIEEMSKFASQFKSADKKMREYVDYIFDGKVSDVCCDGGSMYDPVAGGFWRFEYIIDKIGKLYNRQFGKEMKANEKRMNMHTERYTGKSKYTKSRKSRK